MRQLVLNIRPHAEYRLNNFVVGDNQDLMSALQQQLTRNDGSVLYLWGAPSSGKTHLLRATVAFAQSHRTSRYVSAAQWAPAPLHPQEFVAIDDAQMFSAAAQADVFRLLIGAQEAAASIVMAGNAPPALLPLRPDVQSRVAQGLIFEIKPMKDEHKAATLMQHAQSRGMALGEEVVRYLLRHGRRDLPWLMAVLDALDEASLSLARPVTLPLLREILRNSVEQA